MRKRGQGKELLTPSEGLWRGCRPQGEKGKRKPVNGIKSMKGFTGFTSFGLEQRAIFRNAYPQASSQLIEKVCLFPICALPCSVSRSCWPNRIKSQLVQFYLVVDLCISPGLLISTRNSNSGKRPPGIGLLFNVIVHGQLFESRCVCAWGEEWVPVLACTRALLCAGMCTLVSI